MEHHDSLRLRGIRKQGVSCRNPRLAILSLKSDVQGLLQQLQQLDVDNKQLTYRHQVLLGMWLASRQATQFVTKSIWSATDPITSHVGSPAVNPAVALEDVLLQSIGGDIFANGTVTHNPLKPWLPAQPCPGGSESIILNCINKDRLHGSSEACLLGGNPLSLLLTVLICLCYDETLVSNLLRAREPAQKADTMKTYDKLVRQVNELWSALNTSNETPARRVELHCSMIICLAMTGAGSILGALLFPASGVNSWTFALGDQYLPPDALLDRWAGS